MADRVTLRVGVSLYKEMNVGCFADSFLRSVEYCEPGMELEMLSTVAALMNATLKIVKYSRETGCGWNNGSWTGLFGMLERDEIDVTGNLCTLTPDRLEFEPSWPVLQYRQSFIIKKPSVEYAFNMIAPFRFSVWLTLIAVAVCIFGMNIIILRNRTPNDSRTTWKSLLVELFLSDYHIHARNSIVTPPAALELAWLLCVHFACIFYSAYIALVFLNPVIKHRPFSNQEQLADALLKGEFRLLDYHRKFAATPQCYSQETCTKFRAAIDRHGYEVAMQDNGRGDYGLDQLVEGKNLVMVNSLYWLELYADQFKGPRSELWLLEDEYSGQRWQSFFRQQNNTFRVQFDEALIKMGDFKYYLPELYLGLARYVYRGPAVRGPLPEKYEIDFKLAIGPIKCYAVGITLAIVVFCIEAVVHCSMHGTVTENRYYSNNS